MWLRRIFHRRERLAMMLFQTVDFLAQTLCFVIWVYKWITIIAIFLTWVTPDPHNPIVFWVNRVTYPLWAWCYQRLPASLQLFNAYVALLVVIFLHALIPASVQTLNLFMRQLITLQTAITQIAGHAIQGMGIVTFSILWFAIIILGIWFILTLVSPSFNNPIVRVVHMLADPLITPIQRYLPRTQVDLSPLIGIFILFLVSNYLVTPVYVHGSMLSAPVRICNY